MSSKKKMILSDALGTLDQLTSFKTQILILASFGVAIIVVVFFLIKYRSKIFGLVGLYESLELIKKNQETSKSNQDKMFTQHTELKEQITKIASETIPNGTNQIRKTNDAIDRIEKTVKKIETKVEAKIEIEKAGLFECNGVGECISANSSLCDLFGTTQDQMLGYGWQKFIHSADVDRVHKNWERALSSHQHEITDTYRIINGRDGNVFMVEYKNVFKYDENNKLLSTFGTIWEKGKRDKEQRMIECIHEVITDLKGTPLWNQIQSEIKNKKQ